MEPQSSEGFFASYVDRKGWGLRKRVLREIAYLPLFLIGLSPVYEGELSTVNDEMYYKTGDPLFGGFHAFQFLVATVGTILLYQYYHQQLWVAFWNNPPSGAGEWVCLVLMGVPAVALGYPLVAYMVSRMIALVWMLFGGLMGAILGFLCEFFRGVDL